MAESTSWKSDRLDYITQERIPYFKKEEFEVDWEKVFEGNFGRVYKVKLKLWREKCAIKTFLTSTDYRNMLQVSKIRKIKFKYLMTIYGLCKDLSAVVMEYMSKGSMDNLLTTHALMWPKKFQIIHEVTMGMNILHSMKPPLLHLNLKLSNILLDDHLHVKISDFGIIKWDDSSDRMAFIEHLAERGNISYVPPETFSQNPEPPTLKYDVYSFAIVMWEILTQKRPYCGMNMTEILIRVTSGKRPSVENVPDDKPPEYKEMISIMQRCWHQDLSERPAFSETVWMTEALSDVLKLPDKIPGREMKQRSRKIEKSLSALQSGDSKDTPDGHSDKDIVSCLKRKDFETFKNILKKEHVSMLFKNDNSLLHHAVTSGNTESVRLVLNHGASVNCQNANGYTPLVVALLNKFHKICCLLVECDADVNLAEQDLWTPLHFASQSGDDRAVRFLLDAKAKADVKDKDGWTPLHLAAQNGHENVVRHLLSRLNDVDEQEELSGRTPLHTACEYGHLRIAKILLAKGADPNRTDNAQTTSLHLAAEQGHFRVARLLVTSAADVKCKDEHSYRALHYAALQGFTGICRLLLNHGEDADVRTLQNWTPMHLAALRGHSETLLVLEENGGSVDAQGERGWTPLHLACHHRHDDIVSVLINAGANPNVAEDGGWTPLHLACHNSGFANVLLLIAGHANVNVQNNTKNTPLHLAVQSNSIPIVKALLMNDADKGIVNCKGYTALDLARQANNEEMIQLMKH
ncbi:ankyrin repeat and protein kinase domain-containing protein 1 isoform X2 [Neoarius graeffei]|uniref:ankyrin repeat and protein kinase domain-containing protein 1 isoform X2 n=1 Tax=Neoarius graeffei TaxID=443677 RepID=UPI00298C81F9|nr:ankyrin repeat and protein kinase domain-containing protein 1 isoform X2 [Neoarius graeffei]